MKGGPIKMSIIAHERITRRTGTNWQPTEEQEQAYIFQWCTLMEKQYPELRLCCHIPNGGYRTPSEAVRFKKTGVKKGVPDLFLPVARSGYHGLFIELKRKQGGRLSEEQAQWLKDLSEQGYKAIVCKGGENACDEIYKYLTEQA